ncbi:MAG: DNA repair protein RadA [Lachnospiraceae bacterium]|nr:DNA repair protein RadA [Lachnospiraceae bacterium]
MAKDKTIFFCTECGTEFPKWMGQCTACKAWDSVVEAPKAKPVAAGRSAVMRTPSKAVTLKEVDLREEPRIDTGMEELNRVLGGGIVQGSLVLTSGDPGIGKSTLLLQMCRNLSERGVSVLYVSGEESLAQIKLRAVRIGECGDSLKFLSETDVENIAEQVRTLRPGVVIIDSVQTMQKDDSSGAPGGPMQIREITAFFMRMAKDENISVFLVGHVTKDGAVAGPKILEHMVDTVLYFEGEGTTSFRILRAVKNRFGSTNEIGVFDMRADGLSEVANPSEHMLRGRPEDEPGSVVAVTMEGTRPILTEVQALVSRTSFNLPRRTASGTDINRLNLLTAVAERRAGMKLFQCDIYVNIAGGLRVTEPALDLPIVTALWSCVNNRPLPPGTVVFGEIGLTGELRAVTQPLARVREALKLGYRTCIMSKADCDSIGGNAPKGIRLIGIRSVRELGECLSK